MPSPVHAHVRGLCESSHPPDHPGPNFSASQTDQSPITLNYEIKLILPPCVCFPHQQEQQQIRYQPQQGSPWGHTASTAST